ncbi:globin-coupled sensor protein [Halovenus rubra]|uniref:Globin-coupled sensor protein n=2 Tax=Halovenus rubra TaxID=869890 RepID=A0ABD5XAB8_9EURY|nr:globin-coupled sensor protein [Halovenus rubra]
MGQAKKGSLKVTETERRNVEGAALTDRLGIDSDEIAWRKQYTQFTDEDATRLAEMEDLFAEIAPELVDEFYDHLQSHNETIAIIDSSSKPIETLKENQREYLMELGQGEYGKSYFDRRARIGKIHDMLDLEPKVYFGAYSIYYNGILTRLSDNIKSDLDNGATREAVDQLKEHFLSLQKLINIDQQVAMDTYIDSYNQRVETKVEEQEQLMQRVEDELASPIDELSDAAEDVTESTTVMSGSINEQTDQMDQVSRQVANMSATVEEIASTATQVSETSDQAETLAQEGSNTAGDALSAMEDIEGAVDDVSTDVAALQDQIDNVTQFTTIINDIAEQTNMLALNASIEAARAGEAGDGFGVVADEIKSLATETKQNAGEIEQTVEQAKADTDETAESLTEATEQVEQGMEEVKKTMENLDEILAAVRETAEGIQEVADATDDQAATTEEVASMVDSMVTDLDEMADEIETVAAASEEQTGQIHQIAQTASQLTSDERSN